MIRRRPRAAGAIAAAGYLGVVVITGWFTTRLVRPLFEGFQPAPAYRWVRPPPAFATGNLAPEGASGEVAIAAGTSRPASVFTSDGQVTISLGPGAVAPHGTDTSVRVTISPLDPAGLPAPPAGLRPDGNAYRVTASYRPSGAPVGPLASPGNITFAVPLPARELAVSVDGSSWDRLGGQRVSGGTSEATILAGPGIYLPVADVAPSTDVITDGRHRPVVGTAAVAVAVVVLAGLLTAVPRMVRTRRAGSTEDGPG